jgi:hypothetical protein
MTTIRRLATLSVAVLAAAALLAACGQSKKENAATNKIGNTTTTKAKSSGSGTSSTTASTASTTSTTAAASGPNMTVAPSTGLTDGATVHVKATGFPPNLSLGINECADKGNQTGAGDCDLAHLVPIKSDAAGAAEGDYVVHKGPFGANQIVCGPAQQCLVSVADLSNGSHNASMDVQFAG